MRCHHCSSDETIKHGRRATRNGPIQVYLCRNCGRTCSDNAIPYMGTRPILVLRGMTLFNQGYSLGQCSEMLRQAFKERVPRNTLHYWTRNYSDIFTYLQMRRRDEPKLPIVTKRYNDFLFSYHLRKVSGVHGHLLGLKRYIIQAGRGIPMKGMESSRTSLSRPNKERSITSTRNTTETRIARLVSSQDPNEVHRAILVNDIISLCRNLPVVLSGKDGRDWTGHIPLVQVKDGKVRLLEFRNGPVRTPADLNHLMEQAEALSAMVSVPLSDFQVGCFDADELFLMCL